MNQDWVGAIQECSMLKYVLCMGWAWGGSPWSPGIKSPVSITVITLRTLTSSFLAW